LSTLLTVPSDTPALRATSLMLVVAMRSNNTRLLKRVKEAAMVTIR
jgi:hypothetical protein